MINLHLDHMKPKILLKAYLEYQSKDAFRDLVASTLDQVYSSSLRMGRGAPRPTGNCHPYLPEHFYEYRAVPGPEAFLARRLVAGPDSPPSCRWRGDWCARDNNLVELPVHRHSQIV